VRDALAGFQLAAMNIPQALGYTKIAGMPVITGFYALLLPLLAFAVFGSSRYLVVAADSATASILAGSLRPWLPWRARDMWRWHRRWLCSLPDFFCWPES
jgi:MFS superfamily sulfate permease-like transporter